MINKTKQIKYIVGRNNLAITIFVPYDCPNHCPFCTSKLEYAKSADFSLAEILKSLKKIQNLAAVRDIVITGGEPFADLKQLQKILNACKKTGKHIYINTTLPVRDQNSYDAILKFAQKNNNIINGINVSRHMYVKTNLENDNLLADIYKTTNIRLRINSVLFGNKIEKDTVVSFIGKYTGIVDSISFRGDYTKVIDQNTLRGLDHPILDILFNNPFVEYLSSGGCLVCNNNDFRCGNTIISLHRGYEHSLVKAGCNYIINDIIIKQNGDILIDWDGEPANIKMLQQYFN